MVLISSTACKRSRAAKPTYNSYTSSEIRRRERDRLAAGKQGEGAINFSNKICGGDRVLTESERERGGDIVKIETELSCELRRPQKDHHASGRAGKVTLRLGGT